MIPNVRNVRNGETKETSKMISEKAYLSQSENVSGWETIKKKMKKKMVIIKIKIIVDCG